MGWLSKRSVLLRIIGPRRLGALSYAMRPERGSTWGGPFNGQAYRCLLFASLVGRLRPAAIVETGTHMGTTTEWMAAFQLPVFTCESSEEYFGFAQARLSALPNVAITVGDSREFLRELLAGPLLEASRQGVVFYLDAHWSPDLPLAAEVDLIFGTCAKATVLIDDFQVPDDPGYRFDSYGPGLTLDACYIDAAVRKHRLRTFYPSTPSLVETGMRRGCVVLCKDDGLIDALDGISLLRPSQADTNGAGSVSPHALSHAR